MNENKQPCPLPKHVFLLRLSKNILFGFIIIVCSLSIGMFGYHYFEKMNWVDAFVNASMILSGMGQISSLNTPGGKIFAGLYALFSGVIFLVVVGIIFAPVVHYFFLKFHLADDKTNKRP